MLKLMFFAASLLIFSATSQAQAVYSWRDANGVLNYSDKPPTIFPSGGGLIVQQPTTKPTLLGGVVPPITSGPIGATPGSTTTAIGDRSVFDGTTTPSSTTTAPTGSTTTSSGTTAASSSTYTSPVPSNLPITFSDDFSTVPFRSAPGIGTSNNGKWWVEQNEGSTRVSTVNFGRDGTTALRLHTEPGDMGIPAGNSGERTDISNNQSRTGCYEGREQWWEASVLFPDEFRYVTGAWYMAGVEFHHTGLTGQGNIQLFVGNGRLVLVINGGVEGSNPKVHVDAGPIMKNHWYDFVYHVKWSSGGDGFAQVWVNGTQLINYTGPTLYTGQGCFIKIHNYHARFGAATSVIYDRVIRRDVNR